MMARTGRLFRLLQAMRVMPAPITVARVAAETGVSLRSLYRDIDSLRAAGARVEGECGYGYRLVEDTALPPKMLGRDEMEALAPGLAEVRSMGDEGPLKLGYADRANRPATVGDVHRTGTHPACLGLPARGFSHVPGRSDH